MSDKNRKKIEFGDFQTPPSLARKVCLLLQGLGYSPFSILEPTCGEGNFIFASLEIFRNLTTVWGYDINPNYVSALTARLIGNPKVKIRRSDFFYTNWENVIDNLPSPILVIGNPPWVTNSDLSSLESNNLPLKINFKEHSGLEAITGASNFDISEWMLIKLFEWVRNREATVAMLCKTAVARKTLLHEWKNNNQPGRARIFLIDALAEFGAAVDACLLLYDAGERGGRTCNVYNTLSDSSQTTCFSYDKNQLVANIDFYKKWQHLEKRNGDHHFKWRSGIKHDCSKVMELTKEKDRYVNNLGESVHIENTFVYPMMKSSDLAKGSTPSRFMIVPQKFIGQETKHIQGPNPKTWEYLSKHRRHFDQRKSSIYENKPPFSIFGVGEYSFLPWKVAISGLYKNLKFVVVGPYENKPVVFDDTCYFLACQSEEEAKLIAILLNSEPANEFFSSFIFWDAKRPITAKILNKLNIISLAKACLLDDNINNREYNGFFSKPEQLRLLEQRANYTINY